MKKTIILFSVLFALTVPSAQAETIYTNNADEYASVLSGIKLKNTVSPFSLSVQSEESRTILFVSEGDPAEDFGADYAIFDEYNIHTLVYTSPEKADAAYEALSENGISVCRNTELTLAGDREPNPQYAPYLSWGASAIGTDKATTALLDKYVNVSNMPEVTIVEIDSGIDNTHPFLAGRIEQGFDYSQNPVDPNGTGSTMDENRHGTHVAGIIADNTLPNVKIIPIKVTGKSGTFNADNLYAGLKKATELKPDIINMSIGATTEDRTRAYESKFLGVYNAAQQNGIIICTAAGNSVSNANNADYIFPAYMGNTLTVANSTNNGTLSSTSNYGTVIDLSAPGATIYSTVLQHEYDNDSGTSMSCPFVSAAAAILRTYNKSITPTEVKDKLVANAKDFSYAPVKPCGAGILDIGSVFATPAPSPTPEPTAEPTHAPTETPSITPTEEAAATATPLCSGDYPIELEIIKESNSIYMYTINQRLPSDSTLYIAQYAEDGRLISIITDSISNCIAPEKETASLKAFIFNNQSQQPLALAAYCEVD